MDTANREDTAAGSQPKRPASDPAGGAPKRRHAPSAAQGIDGDMIARIGPNLSLVKNPSGIHVVSQGGAVLSSGTTCWRKGALARPVSPQDQGHRITLHEGLAMTAFYCPASGALLAVDVHEKDGSAIDDVELNLEALSGQ